MLPAVSSFFMALIMGVNDSASFIAIKIKCRTCKERIQCVVNSKDKGQCNKGA